MAGQPRQYIRNLRDSLRIVLQREHLADERFWDDRSFFKRLQQLLFVLPKEVRRAEEVFISLLPWRVVQPVRLSEPANHGFAIGLIAVYPGIGPVARAALKFPHRSGIRLFSANVKPDAPGAGRFIEVGRKPREFRRAALLVCAQQLDELRATLHKPAVAARIKPYRAGRLVNQLKELAMNIGSLPRVERSPDANDDFLLALCEAGDADYLVTGDKSGLLALGHHKSTRIVSARNFAALLIRS